MKPACCNEPMSPAASSDLVERLERALECPVDLVLTRNRSRLVTWRVDAGGRVRLRLHRALADLGPAELATVVDLIRSRPGARAAMSALIERRSSALSEDFAGRAQRLEPTGRVHELAEIRDELLALHFPELPAPPIGWSGQRGRAKRRLRLGSWDSRLGVVRIHRCLDDERVPRFFVASVVHHELCHAALGDPVVVGGRRRLHGADFRALESGFAELEEARVWERENRELLFSGGR